MSKKILKNKKFLYSSMAVVLIVLFIVLGIFVGLLQKKANEAPDNLLANVEENREQYINQKEKQLEEKVNPNYNTREDVEDEEIINNYSKEYEEYLKQSEEEKENADVIPRKYEVGYEELDAIIEKENAIIEEKASKGNTNSIGTNNKETAQNNNSNGTKLENNKGKTTKNGSNSSNTNSGTDNVDSKEPENKDVPESNKNSEEEKVKEQNNSKDVNDKEQQEKNAESEKNEEQQENKTENEKDKQQEDETEEIENDDEQQENQEKSESNKEQQENKEKSESNKEQQENKEKSENNKEQQENKEKNENNKEQQENKEENENNKKQDNKEEESKEQQDTKKEDETNNKTNPTEESEKLPARFNLNDVINIEVENQGGFGLCWDFASLKVLETNLKLTQNLDYNFSEIYVDYMASNLLSSSSRNANEGGKFDIFIDFINRTKGIALDDELEYKEYFKDEYFSFINMNTTSVIVTETADFPTYRPDMNWTDEQFHKYQNAIKKHIMNFGGIYMSTKVQSEKISNWFYESDEAVKLGGEPHALTIVGWDDNYSKENFTSPTGAKPNKDGAYIVLNSRGDIWGDNGYLYISYEDQLVHTDLNGIISTDKADLLKLADINNSVLERYIEENYSNFITYENGIKYISKTIFNNVLTLDLSNKGLTDLSGIELFRNIHTLDISNNNIKDLSKLESLDKLRSLNVSNNPGISGIEKLERLTKLEARNCRITDVSVLSNCKYLLYLDLSYNTGVSNFEKIKDISMRTLKLENCGISDVKDIIKCNVIELDLSNNPLSNLEQLSGEELKAGKLKLRNCNINDAKVINLKNVYELDLSNNVYITNVNELKLDKITSLIISNCNLSEVPDITKFKKLKYLDLSNNNIKDVSALNNTDITELDLSGNTSVAGNLKDSKITYLKLNNCNIDNQFDFFGITNLQALEFSNNSMDLNNVIQKISCKNIEIDNYNYEELSNLPEDLVLENSDIYRTIKIPRGKYRIFLRELYGKNFSDEFEIKCTQGIPNTNYMYVDVNATTNFKIEIRGVNDSEKRLINCNLIVNFEISEGVQPTGIVVTKFPNKIVYQSGEKIDYTGLEISELYGDGAYRITNDYDLSSNTYTEYGKEWTYGSNKIIVKKGNFKTYFNVMYEGLEDTVTIKLTNKELYKALCCWADLRNGLATRDDAKMTMQIAPRLISELARGSLTFDSNQLGELKNMKMVDFNSIQIDYKGVKIDTAILKEMKELFPNLKEIILYKPHAMDYEDVIDEQDDFKVQVYEY